jgi:hypothetical protein
MIKSFFEMEAHEYKSLTLRVQKFLEMEHILQFNKQLRPRWLTAIGADAKFEHFTVCV